MNQRTERILRRALHVCTAFILLYYILPDYIFFASKEVWLIFLLILVYIIELIRRIKKIHIAGLREHEKHTIASYVWFATGAVFLILFFPQNIASPVILMASIGDPVIGETRKYGKIAIISGFIVGFIAFMIYRYPVPIAIIGSILGVGAEMLDIRVYTKPYSIKVGVRRGINNMSNGIIIDDDILMLLIPVLVLYILISFMPKLF